MGSSSLFLKLVGVGVVVGLLTARGAGSMTRGELSCRWRAWPYMYESPMSDPWCWNVSEVEIIDDLHTCVSHMNNEMIKTVAYLFGELDLIS